jgi:hypothetical protein
MAAFDLAEPPQTALSPRMWVGAASPLWGYFGAAAAGGVAFWWMTRWARPANLEALLAPPLLAGPAAEVEEAVVAAAEVLPAMAEAAAETLEEALPEQPVGGEAAPVSPLLDVMPAPPAEGPVEATADPLPAPAMKPRVRKTPPVTDSEA